ncbi:MAG: 30S ribosomal protein S9 [Anaerolineae bacterium]|nr:30S ribosomal protein S9 [Anaerolineae bacterium]
MATTGKYYEGVGRRKSSTARVRIYAGQGSFTVNDRPMEEYFPRPLWLQMMREPMRATQNEGRFTISAKVTGGGPSGQAGAVQLGLARALVAADESFKKALRASNLLTRDPREKERKKPGLKKARKAKQYTKR